MTSFSDITKFIYAGKSIFTLRSRRTDDHFTYKVKKKNDGIYYVFVLSDGYEYIGTIKNRNFFPSKKDGRSLDELPLRAFKWSIDHIQNGKVPSELEFYHEGRCARCSRRLTDPTSLKTGIGPECSSKIVCN
ncbi:hypothetical protein PP935_gp032 [Rhizobium phage RHph_N34]|uniref:Uncharacterized protein n=1 Tax=Rhizobium phage RHph_N34 TaxID=2509586 RepID=A0A7S5RA89_9CAUD|nr:hypothetical protein PP935_gp032 [Rhizobium phage RHph_N34]QIG73807.1 hypothetical protein EVC06_032 [Rhizobium phage RHph_N34]